MANEYVLGTTVTLKIETKDSDNEFVDPLKIVVVIARGVGNFVTKQYSTELKELRRVSQGKYELDFLTSIAAIHTVTCIIKSKNGHQDTTLHQFSVIGVNEQARKILGSL